MPRNRRTQTTPPNGAVVGYEAELWRVVPSLIFLKYISDAFEEHHKRLSEEPYADPEDPDEYRAVNVFWMPPEARWERLRQNARQPTIGQIVDEVMQAVERDNPTLAGVLPKDYAHPALDKQRIGQIVHLMSNIPVGNRPARAFGVSASYLNLVQE